MVKMNFQYFNVKIIKPISLYNFIYKIPKNKNVTVITLDELGEMLKKNEDTRKEEVNAAREIIKLNADNNIT